MEDMGAQGNHCMTGAKKATGRQEGIQRGRKEGLEHKEEGGR